MNKTIELIRQEINKIINKGLYTGSIFVDSLEQLLDFINNLPEALPRVWPRECLEEYAYQCAYDLSNDWAKEDPEWKDVKTACKLGAEWGKERIIEKAIEGYSDGHTIHLDNPIENKGKIKLLIVKEDDLY